MPTQGKTDTVSNGVTICINDVEQGSIEVCCWRFGASLSCSYETLSNVTVNKNSPVFTEPVAARDNGDRERWSAAAVSSYFNFCWLVLNEHRLLL